MIRLACATAALLCAITSAQAGDMKLGDLLSKGFTIQGMTVVPAAMVQKALNNPQAGDELIMVLQRTGEVAFCHYLYAATFSNESLLDGTCFEPQGVAVQPAPPAGASAPASSSELPLSSTASSAQ